MNVRATLKSKCQRIGEDAESFLAREPDRVVTVELDDVVTNPEDMKGGNVSYVGIRKPTVGTLKRETSGDWKGKKDEKTATQ